MPYLSSSVEKKKGRIIRFCLFILASIALFFFLHYKKTHINIPKLHSIAKRYVIAEIDFAFFDETATRLHRQEATKQMGKIYVIPSEKIAEHERNVKHNRNLLQTDEEASKANIDFLLQQWGSWIKNTRYTDPQTIDMIQKHHSPLIDRLAFFPFLTFSSKALPNLLIENWLSTLSPDKMQLSKNEIAFLQQSIKNFSWSLEEDINTEDALQKLLEERVPDVYTRYYTGERLIERGERVTSRHITMLHAMQKALNEKKAHDDHFLILSSCILVLFLIFLARQYLSYRHSEIYFSTKKLTLVILLTTMMLFFTKATEQILSQLPRELQDFFTIPILLPLVGMLLSPLLGKGIAFASTTFLGFVFLLSSPFDNEHFAVINFFISITTLLTMKDWKRRKEIFAIILKQSGVCFAFIATLHLLEHRFIWSEWFTESIGSLCFLILLGILTVGLLPLFETLFRICTEATLMEYVDSSQPILRKLAVEAPGTYHHSLMVGHLAEAAAMEIGANGLFCKVSALYHDIGKLHNPYYYWENQQGNVNMHELLSPEESSKIIIQHVSEGIRLAEKQQLPTSFIDIIREHHGTTLAYYFYYKFCEETKAKGAAPFHQKIKEKNFRYPGPIPQTKESAIIMIADIFEAASRAFEHIDEQALKKLLDDIIEDKSKEKQFDDAPITFQEITRIKKAMLKTMLIAHHSRIKYPAKQKSNEQQQ